MTAASPSPTVESCPVGAPCEFCHAEFVMMLTKALPALTPFSPSKSAVIFVTAPCELVVNCQSAPNVKSKPIE